MAMLFAYAAGVTTPLALVAVASEYVTPLLRRLTPRLRTMERATGAALLVLAGVLAVQVRIPARTSSGAGAIAPGERGAGVVRSGVRRLLFFHSEHCPACRALAALLPDVERACASEHWTLTPIDVDRPENAETVAQFDVRAVPTTSLLDESGHERLRLVGFQPEARLREALEREVQVACADDGPAAEVPTDGMPTCEVGRAC
jgi:cytochrome c-type biogenesis protein